MKLSSYLKKKKILLISWDCYPFFAKIKNRTITKFFLTNFNSNSNSNSNSNCNSNDYIKKGVDDVPKQINGIIDINIKKIFYRR